MRVVRIALSLVLIFPALLSAAPRLRRTPQQSSTTSSTATAVLQKSLLALAPNLSLTDVTLSGSVRRIAGSEDESGSATLKALSSGAARADLSLSSGTFSEIYNSSSSGPAGAWSGPDGVSHPIPFHNLLAESAWFFPAFAISRRLSSGYAITDLGPETHNGQQVEHVSVSQNSPIISPAGTPSFQHLTQLDFYFDSVTSLPTAITFSIHPDNNALLDIPVEIDFSDYRSISGAQIPFHIQRLLNCSLFLDIQLQTVVINSGLAPAAFAVAGLPRCLRPECLIGKTGSFLPSFSLSSSSPPPILSVFTPQSVSTVAQ